MAFRQKHNWKLALGIFLFLASQLMASAHALEFGAAPHEHNGYACVALSVDDHAGVVKIDAALITKVIHNTVASTTRPPVVGRCAALPPATGPPLSI